MPSINANKSGRSSLGPGVGRIRDALNSPAGRIVGMALGATPYGMAINGARLAANVGNRVGYMFDNDPSTGFWRGENAGKPLLEGARNNLGNVGNFLSSLFGPGATQNYQGPPSLAAAGKPPAAPPAYDGSTGIEWINQAMQPTAARPTPNHGGSSQGGFLSGSAYGQGPQGMLGMGVRGGLLGVRDAWAPNRGVNKE